MDTIKQILEHVQQLPQSFKEHMAAGRYAAAAMDHEYAIRIPGLIEMDDEARAKLLAEFDNEQVQKAYKEAGWWKDADGETDRKEVI